jgi:hypothetical protein
MGGASSHMTLHGVYDSSFPFTKDSIAAPGPPKTNQVGRKQAIENLWNVVVQVGKANEKRESSFLSL